MHRMITFSKEIAKKIIKPLFKYKRNRIIIECFLQYFEIWRIRYGVRLLSSIHKDFGTEVHVIIVRGATGDIYLVNALLPRYLEANGVSNYLIVGDGKNLKKISHLFGETNVIELSRWDASCLQSLYKFCGKEVLNMNDLFMWQHSLYFNRCRIRMEERFNFMDTYQWYVFGFEGKEDLKKPVFLEPGADLIEKWISSGIVPGRTVIVSPCAYSVVGMPQVFWRVITERLEALGYSVVFSINPTHENKPVRKVKYYYSSYEESVPMLNFAGAFLGVRSGFSDIVSSATCKMIILYPKALEKNNYSEHRSDILFAGLKVMGLNNAAIEIETNLLRNRDITNDHIKNEITEVNMLVDKILYYFVDWRTYSEH